MSELLLRSSRYASTASCVEFNRHGDGGVVDVVNDAELRKELIERVDKHQEHIELRVQAQVYAQGGEFVNRDRRRFNLHALQSYASTAPKTPLLRDHSRSMRETVGYCESSKAASEGDVLRLNEALVCNHPGSVLPVLRGPVFYSIGISCDWTKVICSVCNATVLDCWHGFWGYARKGRQGERIPVYWMFTEAMADERSLVTVPQAAGTGNQGVEQLATAFSVEFDQCRALYRPTHGFTTKEETMPFKALAEILGIDGDSEEAIVLGFKALKAQSDERASKLKDLGVQVEELKKANTALEAALSEHRTAERDAECEALVTELAEGRHIDADGSMASLIRECYREGNIEFAKKLASGCRESQRESADEKPELQGRQTPADAVPPNGKHAQGSDPPAAPAEPNWAAAFGMLPKHVREFAGPTWANDPRGFFERNPDRAAELGLKF